MQRRKICAFVEDGLEVVFDLHAGEAGDGAGERFLEIAESVRGVGGEEVGVDLGLFLGGGGLRGVAGGGGGGCGFFGRLERGLVGGRLG